MEVEFHWCSIPYPYKIQFHVIKNCFCHLNGHLPPGFLVPCQVDLAVGTLPEHAKHLEPCFEGKWFYRLIFVFVKYKNNDKSAIHTICHQKNRKALSRSHIFYIPRFFLAAQKIVFLALYKKITWIFGNKMSVVCVNYLGSGSCRLGMSRTELSPP